MEMQAAYYATGKRKSSIARTWLMPGSGAIIINNLRWRNISRWRPPVWSWFSPSS